MAADTDEPGFDLGDGHDQSNGAYVVLARKYRPESFTDLIGQDAMVQTLRNAFLTDRIAQGFMLTGVRGVGKTTTARILARALNYERSEDDAETRPTVDFDGYGVHCRDIIKSSHPDVLEMDAASNTGVDNIREIIESARYRPLTARYKVFIIDEVHMLSKGAFNALLKTLEEPPGHVKFIFATTEVRKVPVTVLSRCQRFDLRRVDVPVLMAHFSAIAANENADVDQDALALIARAAEGSVRDGLSILDQAIAMGAGTVTAETVREMIGLADRGRIFDLFETLLGGQAKSALQGFDALYRDGADPVQVLRDLAEAAHTVTKAKMAGASTLGEEFSADERARAEDLSGRLSLAILSRAWQLLVHGLEEANRAPNARSAAEMVLIRLAHTADLPTPGEVIRALGGAPALEARSPAPEPPTNGVPRPEAGQGGHSAGPTGSPAAQALAKPRMTAETEAHALGGIDQRPALGSFEDVVTFVREQRDAMLLMHLEDNVSLIAFEPGRIELNLLPAAPGGLAGELGAKLSKWTGDRWIVTVSNAAGAEPLGVVRRRNDARELAALRDHPAVKAVLTSLPDIEIETVREIAGVADTGEDATDKHAEGSETDDLNDD